MKSNFHAAGFHYQARRFISIFIVILLLATPLLAQRPTATPAKPQPQREAIARTPEPTFENLLGADIYKVYGEVRNVGQLLSTGGAGEIVDPIIKLADPPQQFKAIVKFLKSNGEALADTRLFFASWPVHPDVPSAFVTIEFPTPEEAAKFAPKLETFLPTILPPVPEESESKPNAPTTAKPTETKPPATPQVKDQSRPTSTPAAQPVTERLPFVISHRGNLVFISDKAFKFEKLYPASSKALVEDQNFRIAHDRFSVEPIFVYFNVALEEPKAQPSPKQIPERENAGAAKQRQANDQQANEVNAGAPVVENPPPVQVTIAEPPRAAANATPTPTKQQQQQRTASGQLGQMLELLGLGEPQWPEAVGLSLVLDNNEYIVKAILVEPIDAKKTLIPFVPQLIAGPGSFGDAPSVLPEDTEVFVSASIDLSKTFEGMRKQAEIKAKTDTGPRSRTYENGVLVAQGPPREPAPDPFTEFEKKAGFRIKEDLLPALGNEIAVAGSLSTLQSVGIFGAPPAPKPSPETSDTKSDQSKNGSTVFPMVLIAVNDRDTARRLLPRVLDGLGIGEANMIAQVEKREDTEMVNYAGLFAYAFVGNFVVISEAATVRRVIEANLNHQTLSSNLVYRNARRWQSNRTLGQIYVSPALNAGYQDQIRKQSQTLDPELRDFLLSLDPKTEAITYGLSNEGLGVQHEIHLPKNLILTMVAGISSATKNPPPEANEMIAVSGLHMIASAESSYQSTAGKGAYGSFDVLVAQHLLQKEFFDKYGYKFDVTASSDQFEAVATPREYGKTGKRSFFVDKSGIVRGDDHGGGPATIADKPLQQ